jgi:Leucine-rich repeat (LRR) protein
MRPRALRRHSNKRGGTAASLILGLLLLNGCGKLESAKQLLEPPNDPPGHAPPPVAAQPAEKPLSSAELVAKFVALPRTQKNDEELTRLSEQTDQLPAITELDLAGSAVTDTGAALLPKFTHLKKLDLSVARVTAKSLEYAAAIPALEVLRFGGVPMEDRALTALQRAPALSELALSGTSIGESAFEPLASLEYLKILELNDNKQMLGRNFTELVKQQRFRNLTKIVSDSSGFGYYGLLEIGRLPNLEHLSVSRSMVGDEAIQGLKSSKSLKRLYLADNLITDKGLPVFRTLPGLEELRLSGNPAITDAGLKELRGLKQLKELSLDGTRCTMAGVTELKKFLKSTKITFGGQTL